MRLFLHCVSARMRARGFFFSPNCQTALPHKLLLLLLVSDRASPFGGADARAEEASTVGKSDASRALGAIQCRIEEASAERNNRPDVKRGEAERKNEASQ